MYLNNQLIKIIFYNEDFIVINKSAGIPSCPLKSLEEDSALSRVIKQFEDVLLVKGKKEIEYGLVHRIDTLTEGLLLIARNQFAYDFFIQEQNNLNFIKEYTAYCNFNSNLLLNGYPPFYKNLQEDLLNNKKINIKSHFRPYGKKGSSVRPVCIEKELNSFASNKKTGSTIYQTQIECCKLQNNIYKCKCKITKGFRHQVRCHLAWAGFPVINDPLYNCNPINMRDDTFEKLLCILDQNKLSQNESFDKKKSSCMRFYATGLEFNNPRTLEKMYFNI